MSMQVGVQGMTCDHCVKAVSEAARSVDGVDDAQVDLDAGTVTVEGDSVDMAELKRAIVEAGYELAE